MGLSHDGESGLRLELEMMVLDQAWDNFSPADIAEAAGISEERVRDIIASYSYRS